VSAADLVTTRTQDRVDEQATQLVGRLNESQTEFNDRDPLPEPQTLTYVAGFGLYGSGKGEEKGSGLFSSVFSCRSFLRCPEPAASALRMKCSTS
jgi:hypothetical protein